MKLVSVYLVVVMMCLSLGYMACTDPTDPNKAKPIVSKAYVGSQIFNDKSYSNPAGQSCGSCHFQQTGFSDPNHEIVSPGIVPGLYGNRNAPSIGYSMFTPDLYWDNTDSVWVGGYFLDGRAHSLEDQARAPFLNHVEMNMANRTAVVAILKTRPYFIDFQKLYGYGGTTSELYDHMVDAIAAYERTPTFNSFTSKFDAWLDGKATFTAQEKRGYDLFKDTSHAKCSLCHLVDPDEASGKILFTDFTYDNIGIPKNPRNPFYTCPTSVNPDGMNYIDRGLGKTLGDPTFDGAFKVPTLRNVELSAPYFHNGYFTSLDSLVHWYSIRDSGIKAGIYPNAEIPGNMNVEELGNLHLTPQEEADIVAFMKTLTDGYR